jgi:thiamine biosynthesis lipoprotein
METFAFSALGTQWSLLIDHEAFSEHDTQALLEMVAHFEKRFSRFIETSEVNQFRTASSGTYEISEELAQLLTRADMLRQLTGGHYDPAVGKLLEHAGYDPSYRFSEDTELKNFVFPEWSIEGRMLTVNGPTVFDLGGIGKGYCIDLIAQFLKNHGYMYFLVEGGGDMYGTTKKDDSGYRVALEWPGKPDTAFGIVELRNQGIAVSDSFKRRWKNWHHIIDPKTKKPIEGIIGCTALAKSAFDADCLTSGLFLSSPEEYKTIAAALQGQYVVFKKEGSVMVSPGWPGELF